jgi:hypothetical protein
MLLAFVPGLGISAAGAASKLGDLKSFRTIAVDTSAPLSSVCAICFNC